MTRMIRLFALLLLLAAAAGAWGILGSSGSTVAEAAVAPLPDAFPDAFGADAAGDRRQIWVVVTGRSQTQGSPIAAKVFRLNGTSWEEVAPVPHRVDPDSPLSLVLFAGVPCVASMANEAPYVSCFRDGLWEDLPVNGQLAGGVRVAQLTTIDKKLALLTYADPPATSDRLVASSRRARPQVLTFSRRRWRRLGQPLPSPGALTRLGEVPRGGRDDAVVGVTAAGPEATRTAWTYRGGRWREMPSLPDHTLGPMTSGPILVGRRIFFPVVNARGDAWPFSVFTRRGGAWARVGGGALNRGAGKAQGTISYADGAVWATWQENAQRADHRFDTEIFAARIDPTSARVLGVERLWRGVSLGPSDVEVVSGAGRTWALYMRGKARGLRATMTPLDG